MDYLVSFHPLCSTSAGRHAVKIYDLPGFIDSACRREPDLESDFPSITALCRAGKFAPRLNQGDRVLYMSVKRRYGKVRGRALVAALEVIKTFKSHEEAALWYIEKGLPLPSNCMANDNAPIPVAKTRGLPKNTDEVRKLWSAPQRGNPTLKMWDAAYKTRAIRHPSFVVTSPISGPSLKNPRIYSDEELKKFLTAKKVPGTQNFKILTGGAFDALANAIADK